MLTEGILTESLLSAGGTKQHIENEKRMSGRTEEREEISSVQSDRPASILKKSKKVF